MNRIFTDMDGVIVDFSSYVLETGFMSTSILEVPGVYVELPPCQSAVETIHKLPKLGYEVWIATCPHAKTPHNYSDKATWILKHLPELIDRVIMTHDKGMLGTKSDFLIDDHPERYNIAMFAGTFLEYKEGFQWPEIYKFFEDRYKRLSGGKMKSILKDWLMILPIRYQGSVLTAIRGEDGMPAEDSTKTLVRGIRNVALNPASPKALQEGGFMPFKLEELLPAARKLAGDMDSHSEHFITHLLQGLEAIAYGCPDKAMGTLFEEAYNILVKARNLNPETSDEFHARLVE